MEVAHAPQRMSWTSASRAHAAAHPGVTAGLALAVLAVLYLLGNSVVRISGGDTRVPVQMALLGGVAGFAATALGALAAPLVRGMSQKIEDSMLGLAAGMMLAASSFSLILPGLASGTAVTGHAALGALVVVIGMALGVLLMLGLDEFTPHEHTHLGACGPAHQRVSRIWLFVLAITLHNLPEGMAIGASFAHGDLAVGLPLTSAIALQDIPEGLAVAMALRGAGLSALRAALVGAATGVLEPVGALLGVGLSSGLALAYPIGLGLAAGAMIFVVSHEVIPETHRNGHQTPATLGLMAGFAVMMMLDTALG
jgi:ZIP family zinc transporter